MTKTLLISVFSVFGLAAQAIASGRIEAVRLNLGKVEKLHLKAKMVSLVEIPEHAEAVFPGNPVAITYKVVDVPGHSLVAFWLNQELPQATNVLIYANGKVYSFDVLANAGRNNDFKKVEGSFGGPDRRKMSGEKIIASSMSSETKK
jgi:hypothetical protein